MPPVTSSATRLPARWSPTITTSWSPISEGGGGEKSQSSITAGSLAESLTAADRRRPRGAGSPPACRRRTRTPGRRPAPRRRRRHGGRRAGAGRRRGRAAAISGSRGGAIPSGWPRRPWWSGTASGAPARTAAATAATVGGARAGRSAGVINRAVWRRRRSSAPPSAATPQRIDDSMPRSGCGFSATVSPRRRPQAASSAATSSAGGPTTSATRPAPPATSASTTAPTTVPPRLPQGSSSFGRPMRRDAPAAGTTASRVALSLRGSMVAGDPTWGSGERRGAFCRGGAPPFETPAGRAPQGSSVVGRASGSVVVGARSRSHFCGSACCSRVAATSPPKRIARAVR